MNTLFLVLLFGHALADYPLQGDFLAKAKNQTDPIPGVPWYQGLFWHAFIHAGFVTFITSSFTLGAFEFVAHVCIDYAKSAKKISFNADQLLHIACKIVWTYLSIRGL